MRPSTAAFLLAVLAFALAVAWASGQPNIPIAPWPGSSPSPSASAS
jgi:hypothetical protein